MASRKNFLVRGVGINDVKDSVEIFWGGPVCVRAWNQMLMRCYCPVSLSKRPTYQGCTVTEGWLKFSCFLAWAKENYVDGWVLDKDLLSKRNKIYRPDACMFIPQEVNKFLTLRQLHRGVYPLGVHRDRKTLKFIGQASFGDGKRYQLGFFNTPEEAHKAWQLAKAERCKQLIEKYSAYPKVVLGLQRVLKDLEHDIQNNLITETL